MNPEKNAKVISVLLIVVLLLLFYFIPYKKMDTQKTQLSNEINNLTATYNTISQDINKKDNYLEGIEEFKSKIESIDKNLPADLSQELLIYTINDIEKTIDIKMPNISFGIVETVSQLNQTIVNQNINQAGQTTQTTQTQTTQTQTTQTQTQTTQTTQTGQQGQATTDSNMNNQVTPEQIYQETGIKRSISTTTIMTYAQLKSLMAYLYGEGMSALPTGMLSNKNRIVLKNLSLSSDTETGNLSATFTLTFYGLQSAKREPQKIELGDFNIGKDGVFLPFSEYGIKFTVPQNETKPSQQISDFFIMLSPITADQTTVTMGKASGMSSSSFVYADANEFVDVTLEIFKENNIYYYRYSAGSETYPVQGSMAFDPGNQLDLLVLSNKRNSSDDNSGANVTIVNNTDLTLNIINTGDDLTYPRFKVVSTNGKVSGY